MLWSPLQFQFTHPGRGATLTLWLLRYYPHVFQFTHPGRGATPLRAFVLRLTFRFNSRTPGGVRPQSPTIGTLSLSVSIHAPREGCDAKSAYFFSSPEVSIHAPREGCDVDTADGQLHSCGFQFTHPGRGATWFTFRSVSIVAVSIHAPREGCDSVLQSCVLWGG